jgi:hypothetical protein
MQGDKADSRIRIAIAGEDQAHRVLATNLIDAAILERAHGGWPEPAELSQCRVYCGLNVPSDAPPYEHYYRFQTLHADLRAHLGRKPFRVARIGDQPAGQATWFISLYQLFALAQPRPDILVGMLDTDDPRLHEDAERARRYILDTHGSAMTLVFGLIYKDAEAWFVAGLTDVAARIAQAKQELSFDPCAEPDRLTAHPNSALTDAKRVLRFLLGHTPTLAATPSIALSGAEADALAERTLRDLGLLASAASTGLSDFIASLRTLVAPRILPGP